MIEARELTKRFGQVAAVAGLTRCSLSHRQGDCGVGQAPPPSLRS
jgi:hypothetical protein